MLRPVLLVIAEVLLAALVTLFVLLPEVWNNLIAGVSGIALVWRVLVVALVDVVLLWLISRQLHSAREPVRQDGLLVRDNQALAAIQIESVRDFVQKEVQRVPNVTAADTRVKALHNRADIELDVTYRGDRIDVRKMQNQINRVLKQVVVDQLGLRLAGRPRVFIRLESESIAVMRAAAAVTVPSAPRAAAVPDPVLAVEDRVSPPPAASAPSVPPAPPVSPRSSFVHGAPLRPAPKPPKSVEAPPEDADESAEPEEPTESAIGSYFLDDPPAESDAFDSALDSLVPVASDDDSDDDDTDD